MSSAEKTPEVYEKNGLRRVLEKHGTVWAVAFIIIGIFINSLQGGLGIIGPDSDDVIRLVQIKDYLAGQSWFHTDQYRMGLAGGTDMHWSRLPDIPIIVLTHIFDVFMPQERALAWAITIWPPVSALLLIWAFLIGAKHWGGAKTKLFTLILLAVFLIPFFRFAPGAIDHHNLQMGFIGLAMACAMDPKLRFWSYFISGFALAMSIAIGAEIYVFAAIICGFVALNWALLGKAAATATQGFGIGFSATLIFAFLATISPSEYDLIYCDALSLFTVTAGILGGLGLAGLAKLNRLFALEDTIPRRFLGLLILGVICGGALLFQAPQCLVNPLDNLPDEVVHLWLNNVSEAQSITHAGVDKTTTVPYMMCAPIIAVIVIILDIRKNHKRREQTEPSIWMTPENIIKFLPLMLLISALGMTIYQVRFYPFAYVFALAPLAGWISSVYTETKHKNPASVIYLAAVLAAVPLAWAVPGVLAKSSEAIEVKTEKNEAVAKCTSDDVRESLNALPIGTIVANPNMSGFILNKTQHRTVSGNYHRNWKGIAAQIQIAVSDPSQSQEILLDNNIDYLYYCAGAAETSIYAQHNKKGLTASLSEGVIPDYLDPMSSPELEEGDVIIFKVKRPST